MSLQARLHGGGRCLALTIRRLNSLLTEKNTGICEILLSKIALLLAKSHILREKQPITCKSERGINRDGSGNLIPCV